MKTLNSPILSIALLALVLWLGHTSEHRKPLTMESLIEQSLADSKRHKAETLKEIWQLSDADITAPVDLYGEKGAMK